MRLNVSDAVYTLPRFSPPSHGHGQSNGILILASFDSNLLLVELYTPVTFGDEVDRSVLGLEIVVLHCCFELLTYLVLCVIFVRLSRGR
jgi:hypothetical protein